MGFIKDYLEEIKEFFEDYFRERRQDKVRHQAYALADQEKYAEAAEVYVRFAPQALVYNELMYCLYSYYAFEMWLQAQDADNALQQARNILRVLSSNDGKWLKFSSGKQADVLFTIVTKLYAARYIAEAEMFSREVNEQLEKYELPMRCAAAPISKNKFPSLCPHCGAKLPYHPTRETLECSHCGTVIYPQ